MKTLRLVIVMLLVGAGQSLASQIWYPLGWFDALMVLVVDQALKRPFEPSVLIGAGAGLVQDSLAGGLVGLHAFSKTAVAAVIASLGRVVVLRGPLTASLVTGVAAFAGAVLENGLLAFLDWPARESLGALLARGALTALLSLAFLSVRPWVVMKWRRWRGRSF